jgi:hypothetical protein
MATEEVTGNKSERELSTAERLMHWLFFGVIMTLIPFMAAMFGDIDRGIRLSFATLFGQGELLIVATIISAGGIGELFGSEISETRRMPKLLLLGFCVISLVATCIWFADISSLLVTRHPADPETVAVGSIVLFFFAVIEGLAALILSEA